LRWAKTLDLASALSSGSNFGWSLFFFTIPRICMAAFPIARLRRGAGRPIVNSTIQAAFVAPLLQGQKLRLKTSKALPIPSGGAFLFLLVRSCRPSGKFCRLARATVAHPFDLFEFFPARSLHHGQ
jgi:hypothetical protein